jgi:indole-3-acetate monooxygenase
MTGATDQQIFDEVTDLLAGIGERREEIAALRRLPPDLVAALRTAGAFRIALPVVRGGPEMSPRRQTELVELLSRADPSVGWCVMIGSDSSYFGAFMDPAAADGLFADPDCITAGHVQPAGRAIEADGQLRVNGRWAFGSGCTHADVIVGGCLVFDDDAPRMLAGGRPDWRIVAAPADEYEIIDTWYTTGLAGSGSNDYAATDLVVPVEHAFSFYDQPRRPEPLFAFPGMFVANMSGVPLGLARRAIDLVVELAQDKLVMPEMVMMREQARVQIDVARAETALGSARAYVYESLDRLWDVLNRGQEPDPGLRRALTLSRANSFRVARDVTQLMCDTAGASSVYTSHPLGGLLRDAITMKQHVVAQDRVIEMVGANLLTGSALLPVL